MEARLVIGQLPIRYAIAVDSRNLDDWVNLFVPDVEMGRKGSGREVLRAYIEPQLRSFYRSIHQICGHRIDLGPDADDGTGPTTASGSVYCRAEHEIDDRWVVMAIRYDDEYARVGDDWLFTRRREQHWYAVDANERPQAVGFDSWGSSGHRPPLPAIDPSWSHFWRDGATHTAHPVENSSEESR
ncbi:nuclear transport factor 2 family protein [Gordonia polyisoprenivorans]|nr:nuclear transport factor 2 family protein [Gordonia polyisoprenivorans]